MAEFDYKKYARQMRKYAVRDKYGSIICSLELWEQIATIIENIHRKGRGVFLKKGGKCLKKEGA